MVDNVGDVVTETSTIATEIDTVQSSISYILGANLENLVLSGTAALNGTGNALNNTLTGNAGANKLDGGAGNDMLNGGAGADTLVGGAGNDTLTGGTEADRFVFSTTLGASNVDTLVDFSKAQGDTMALDSAFFASLAGKTDLSKHFRTSAQAPVGGDDFIVYDMGTGQLFYDAAGTNTGTSKAQWFATLSNKPQDLSASQFVVI